MAGQPVLNGTDLLADSTGVKHERGQQKNGANHQGESLRDQRSELGDLGLDQGHLDRRQQKCRQYEHGRSEAGSNPSPLQAARYGDDQPDHEKHDRDGRVQILKPGVESGNLADEQVEKSEERRPDDNPGAVAQTPDHRHENEDQRN